MPMRDISPAHLELRYRHRGSVVLRWRSSGMTWRAIGLQLGLSHERVRQIAAREKRIRAWMLYAANGAHMKSPRDCVLTWTPEMQSYEQWMGVNT
jgi:Sigma-70, region 4